MSKLTKLTPKSLEVYEGGREEDYVDTVRILLDADAIRPGSTKIREICVKPVTVHSFIFN